MYLGMHVALKPQYDDWQWCVCINQVVCINNVLIKCAVYVLYVCMYVCKPPYIYVVVVRNIITD